MSLMAIGRSRLNNLLGGSAIVRRIASLSAWTLVSFAIEKGASIAVILLVARFLGAEDFGRLVLAQGLVNTLQIVVVLGAGPVFTRYVPVLRQTSFDRATELISLCFAIAGVMSVLLIGFMSTLGGAWVLDVLDARDAALPGIIAIWAVLGAGTHLAATVATSFERGRSLGLIATLGAAASVIVVPVSAQTYGLVGALAALASVELMKLTCLLISQAALAKREGGSLWRRPRSSDLSLLSNFGVIAFLTSAIWPVTMWLCPLIFKDQVPDGLAHVAAFGFANTVLGSVLLVSMLTNRAAMPILASLSGQKSGIELRRISGGLTLLQFGAAICVSLPIALLAPWIMGLAGDGLSSQWPVLLVMIVAGVVMSTHTSMGNYLLVTDGERANLVSIALWSAVVLAVAWLCGDFGALGGATAILAGSVVRTAALACFCYAPARLQV